VGPGGGPRRQVPLPPQGDGDGQIYLVVDDPVPHAARHAVSHVSAVHRLAARTGNATFRQVEVGRDRIEPAYIL
jgi:hypothetical protein